MRRLLEASQDGDKAIQTIAVAGSLGRMEQLPGSDIDLIVVTNEEQDSELVQQVWRALDSLKLKLPKPDGIYGRAVTVKQLISRESLGIVDEDKAVFGLRMQLLIEGRPVWNDDGCAGLQRAILERFADSTANDPADTWRPLLDDLLRYHRSLCVHYQRLKREQIDNWEELVTKAGHSRLIGIAGLLFLLGESTRADDPLDFVSERLSLTPLQRIHSALNIRLPKHETVPTEAPSPPQAVSMPPGNAVAREGRGEGELYAVIADCHERFLTTIANNPDDDLADNARLLKRTLLDCILHKVDRRLWPRRFLEHLML